MEIAEHIHILDEQGQLLARAAEAAGPDAKVPSCPEWQVRDLVRHTGVVHRWAAEYVATGRDARQPLGNPPDLDGAALFDWYREGHAALVTTLSAAPPDLECWAFLPAPSPLAFWARRQAHETAVHRVDAESARGGALSPVRSEFGADGIDELLRGFHARARSRARTAEPRVLRVRATDADDAVWTVRLSDEPPVTERGAVGEAECELSGPAALLYLALWNRAPFPEVSGDSALATLWQEKAGV
jgi:uncharacterized protein (TIGR03083 family)